MAKMPDDLKTMFEKQLAVIATAGKDGAPNVGPKGSIHALDDETLIYAESTGKKTLANLKENPKVMLLAMDRLTGKGYQVRGTAQLVASGELFDRVAKRQLERKRSVPKLVVMIKVGEIFPV